MANSSARMLYLNGGDFVCLGQTQITTRLRGLKKVADGYLVLELHYDAYVHISA